jgi:hypothetical protein
MSSSRRSKTQSLSDIPADLHIQRRSFALRKSLVLLRRAVIPVREVTNTLKRRDLHAIHDDLMPCYQDVYDPALRAAEWTESLRDLVNSILETNLIIERNQMNVITEKATSWAAIIAMPTFNTGSYAMTCLIPPSAGPAVRRLRSPDADSRDRLVPRLQAQGLAVIPASYRAGGGEDAPPVLPRPAGPQAGARGAGAPGVGGDRQPLRPPVCRVP